VEREHSAAVQWLHGSQPGSPPHRGRVASVLSGTVHVQLHLHRTAISFLGVSMFFFFFLRLFTVLLRFFFFFLTLWGCARRPLRIKRLPPPPLKHTHTHVHTLVERVHGKKRK
jgi:hypothetical protein